MRCTCLRTSSPASARGKTRSRPICVRPRWRRKAGEPNEAYHASDYAVYAYLQLARDDDAKRAMEEAFKVTDFNPAVRAAPYAIAAMPARYAMERGAWREAMQLQPQPTKFPYTDAITYFARALGAARSGDVAAAEKEAAELARLHKALQDAKDNYWATEVEVQRLAVAGWIALAQGKPDDALKFMRAAADLEDKNEKSIVTPGRIVPARELLGDMLLELKQPALALKEFEASHVREPNRFRGYYGAARAAEAAGDRRKAADYYAKLMELGEESGSRDRSSRAHALRGATIAGCHSARLRGRAVTASMKQPATACAVCLLFALWRMTPVAVAEPYEDTPNAAARDPDYAAGKAADGQEKLGRGREAFSSSCAARPGQRRSAELPRLLLPQPRSRWISRFKHYKRSIELNPRHRGAHEYIGEAYLMVNDLPNAEKHLAALRSICLLRARNWSISKRPSRRTAHGKSERPSRNSSRPQSIHMGTAPADGCVIASRERTLSRSGIFRTARGLERCLWPDPPIPEQVPMPYVRRNPEGSIVALLAEPAPDALESLPSTHIEVLAFLGVGGGAAAFGTLDADFVRVTEDLIYTLIEKGVLQFTDLPQEAQRKLEARQSFRGRRIDGALDLLGHGETS